MRAFSLLTLSVFIWMTFAVNDECREDMLMLTGVDLNTLPVHQLKVLTAVGIYQHAFTSSQLLVYQHIAREDVFLLRSVLGSGMDRVYHWAVAALSDDKKPRNTSQLAAGLVWPDPSNLLVEASFAAATSESSGFPWNMPGWSTTDACGRDQVRQLRLQCLPRATSELNVTPGQCSTGVWRVSGVSASMDGLYQHRSGDYLRARPVYKHSTTGAELSVNSAGLWRLRVAPASSTSSDLASDNQQDMIDSLRPALALEYVNEWRRSNPDQNSVQMEDGSVKVLCEPLPLSLAASVNASLACMRDGASLCANDGRCFAVGQTHYQCRCRFDSVSSGCRRVQECRAPPSVVFGQLIYFSGLELSALAFYQCDVGYVFSNGSAKTSTSAVDAVISGQASGGRLRFGLCDGSRWRAIPHCIATPGVVTLRDAYTHQCNWRQSWCGYDPSPLISLKSLSSSQSMPEWTLKSHPDRMQIAVAGFSRTAMRDLILTNTLEGKEVTARLRSPCISAGGQCLVMDIRTSAGAKLNLVDPSTGSILWQSQKATEWTTLSIPLNNIKTNGQRLKFWLDAILSTSEKFRNSPPEVAVDNVRVFAWNCSVSNRLLFGGDVSSGCVMCSSHARMWMWSMWLCLVIASFVKIH